MTASEIADARLQSLPANELRKDFRMSIEIDKVKINNHLNDVEQFNDISDTYQQDLKRKFKKKWKDEKISGKFIPDSDIEIVGDNLNDFNRVFPKESSAEKVLQHNLLTRQKTDIAQTNLEEEKIEVISKKLSLVEVSEKTNADPNEPEKKALLKKTFVIGQSERKTTQESSRKSSTPD